MLRLPHFVVCNPKINRVLTAHVDSFEALDSCAEIRGPDDEAAFVRIIQENLRKHNPGTRLIAEGYRDVRRMYPEIILDEFMHDHFTTRIATRILMDNYLGLTTPLRGYLGVVCQGMKPLDIVMSIVDQIIDLTRSVYGIAPNVEYRGNLDCVLDYIPRHVQYMVRELIKNAFRSQVERYSSKALGAQANGNDIPPVVVELQQGDVHVIIKISDQGGGISKSAQRDAWNYGWTTVKADNEHHREVGMYAEESCPWMRGAQHAPVGRKTELAGYGFGLPLTRLHAQYFGGDVFMQALPGHGTDMYLLLTHLKEGTDATEVDDVSTILYKQENQFNSSDAPEAHA
jgi:signal transduction histidine kinase